MNKDFALLKKNPLTKDKYSHKIENILKIINILIQSEYPVSIEYLSKNLHVTKKSVYRYIHSIQDAGFPIESIEDETTGKPTGRYHFFNKLSLKNLNISKEEITLLVILHDFSKKMKSKFNDSFQLILNKVLTNADSDCYYFKLPDGIVIPEDNKFFGMIENAIRNRKKLRLSYVKNNDTTEKIYKVTPLKILYFDGFWYFACITETNRYFIKFRVDNIRTLEILKESFPETDINIRQVLEKSVNAFFPMERNITVKLNISNDVSAYFKSKQIFPEQKIISENETGLVVETRVKQFMEIIPIIFNWMPNITVMEPEELKKEIKVKIDEYLKKI